MSFVLVPFTYVAGRRRSRSTPSMDALRHVRVIDPLQRQRRKESWKRWERAASMELWQFDVVHGAPSAPVVSGQSVTSDGSASSDQPGEAEPRVWRSLPVTRRQPAHRSENQGAAEENRSLSLVAVIE